MVREMQPWETCPICGTRRTVVCPYCHTEGNQFPLADPETMTIRENVPEGNEEDGASQEEDAEIVAKPFLAESLGVAYSSEIRLENVPDEKRCSCGKEGKNSCQTPHSSLKLVDPLEKDPELDPTQNTLPLAVMCPVCDEFLYPKFLDTCQHCGHPFANGISRMAKREEDFYENVPRMMLLTVVMVLFLLILTLGLVLAFFMSGN
ncbi:MAG: hypothetical protein Q4E67_03150 [Planctomycetia bacterium]|nr:hypothetical protein [Planctomycetia bacterium]